MLQRTLVLIKPDAVYNLWIDEIKQRYRDAGLKILSEYCRQMARDDAAEFYAEHRGKFFFGGLLLAISSGPLVALIISGDDAVERVRKLNGATNPDKAEPGTIRHDFKSAGGPFNTVHGSDSVEAAEREIALMSRWGFTL